jgi:iron complex outermembrane receptor protein
MRYLLLHTELRKNQIKTGAVTQVTSKELNKGRITDPIQGMQGKAAGVKYLETRR